VVSKRVVSKIRMENEGAFTSEGITHWQSRDCRNTIAPLQKTRHCWFNIQLRSFEDFHPHRNMVSSYVWLDESKQTQRKIYIAVRPNWSAVTPKSFSHPFKSS
jgi:hypothetical protein